VVLARFVSLVLARRLIGALTRAIVAVLGLTIGAIPITVAQPVRAREEQLNVVGMLIAILGIVQLAKHAVGRPAFLVQTCPTILRFFIAVDGAVIARLARMALAALLMPVRIQDGSVQILGALVAPVRAKAARRNAVGLPGEKDIAEI